LEMSSQGLFGSEARIPKRLMPRAMEVHRDGIGQKY
jgi:hypothetical protein